MSKNRPYDLLRIVQKIKLKEKLPKNIEELATILDGLPISGDIRTYEAMAVISKKIPKSIQAIDFVLAVYDKVDGKYVSKY